jgi:hypothetical protein
MFCKKSDLALSVGTVSAGVLVRRPTLGVLEEKLDGHNASEFICDFDSDEQLALEEDKND